jgi:hypothetical protein
VNPALERKETEPMRRMGVLGAALLWLALGGPPETRAAAADKTWCMTYCDTIHLGCKKTLGWFDDEACDQWKKGCLDGCRVAD